MALEQGGLLFWSPAFFDSMYPLIDSDTGPAS